MLHFSSDLFSYLNSTCMFVVYIFWSLFDHIKQQYYNKVHSFDKLNCLTTKVLKIICHFNDIVYKRLGLDYLYIVLGTYNVFI